MDRNELGKALFESSHITGDFLLRSGTRASEYFDKYRFEARPQLLRAIAEQMAPLLPQNIDALAALEMGGIPIGTALSLQTGLPCVFVRKEAKKYGTCQFAEGLETKGKRLCVIEDVITTGGQVLLSTNDLRKQGAIIEEVRCVIYRGKAATPQEEPKIVEARLNLKPLFTMSELKSHAG